MNQNKISNHTDFQFSFSLILKVINTVRQVVQPKDRKDNTQKSIHGKNLLISDFEIVQYVYSQQ